ncbi:MAG: hypothetical protein ABW000_07140 [Actinoplanes sp.]
MAQPTIAPSAVSPPLWPLPIIAAAIRHLHAVGFRHQVDRYGRQMHTWKHPDSAEIGVFRSLTYVTIAVTDDSDLRGRLLDCDAVQAVQLLAILELLPRTFLTGCWGSDVAVPFDPGTGPVPGYVAGWCGHRVAESEWRAGFRVCERCPDPRATAGIE